MKHTRLSRKTRLKTRTPLKRGDSRLERTGKLKTRGVMERTKDDPDRYGDLFWAVRSEPCFGLTYVTGHECGMGIRPATAHHLGRKDSEGMVPACPLLHDLCHDQPWKVREALEEAGSPPLEELGAKYVANAKSS